MNQFVLGMAVMGAFVAGLFFIRFWRRTRDRLFLIFSAAFWLMSLNWLLLAFFSAADETDTSLYAIRLVAFLLILVAIIDKNRKGLGS